MCAVCIKYVTFNECSLIHYVQHVVQCVNMFMFIISQVIEEGKTWPFEVMFPTMEAYFR
jgi:hypothetical protein